LAPSSFEILFPAEQPTSATSSNVTLGNIEAHHKPCRTAPQNTSKQRQKHHTETGTTLQTQTEKPRFHHKKIFQTHTSPLYRQQMI